MLNELKSEPTKPKLARNIVTTRGMTREVFSMSPEGHHEWDTVPVESLQGAPLRNAPISGLPAPLERGCTQPEPAMESGGGSRNSGAGRGRRGHLTLGWMLGNGMNGLCTGSWKSSQWPRRAGCKIKQVPPGKTSTLHPQTLGCVSFSTSSSSS